MTWLSRFQPQLLALLRITAAYMYFWHGTAKFFGYPTAMGHVELLSLKGAGWCWGRCLSAIRRRRMFLW